MFSIVICRQSGDKWQSKTLFLTIFDQRSSIVLTFSIAAFNACFLFTVTLVTCHVTVLVCPTAQCVPRTKHTSLHVTPVAKFKQRRYVRFPLALCFVILGTTRSVFNNASARSAFSVNASARQGACKLSRFKLKSKMAT